MFEDDVKNFDPGLCVGCQVCFWGSPRICPLCRISEEGEDDITDK